MRIAAKNLSYTYNKGSAFQKQALMNVNLEINDGEFVAIVGHTGSGKTTFVQHLNALIRVQEGELTVGEYELGVKKVDFKKLRGDVGMVFQYPEYQLFADTVLDDVCFGPKNVGISREEAEKRAEIALTLVGLDFDAIKSKSPFDMSGGEKRRVALAGVLAMEPKVLVLDEPTAGLDPRGKREILGLVGKLNREKGITVVMVSHDMNEVYENANRVIVFKDGRVAYDMLPRELFRKEEEIEKMNLEVPQIARFLNELYNRGYRIEKDCRTVEQAFDAVMELKGGKRDV